MFQNLRNIIVTLATLVAFGSCSSDNTFSEPLPDTVDFNFHIRPILVQNCYLCHGPDPSGRKADLRLDTYEGATTELKDGGYAIVEGTPSKSQLVHRINHKDEDMMMPPPESNYKLTEREKALLEKWIDQGAEWKEHWAFIKPKSAIATSSNKAIDSLIDIRLEQQNLIKTPIASKNSLIRRVSYLLTGLPPTQSAIEKFINDESDDAYLNMVDDYLNASAYGERWARHWMDLVRYAETKGHEFDYSIVGAWHYRDYLIKAFNQDVPYDQLIKEHLAGDLLKIKRYDQHTRTSESHLGTAFYAMAEGTHSPVDLKKDEADRIDNMIDVTTKTFQGLTVSCAKCHDHKFDPILTADYYGLYGIMESTRFSPVVANSSMHQEKSAKEIDDLKVYMRGLVSEKWKEPLIAKNDNEDKADILNVSEYQLLGDFRNHDLDGWKSNGLAFGNKTTLGDPIINSSGKLLRLDTGRASSKNFGLGIFGSLQSQNLSIDKDFIGVRARGKKSIIRIVIDNFQLIQDPIYGELEMKVDADQWKDYVVDLSPWKGHKFYIEILPGGYDRHRYQFPDDAYIEVQYAVAFNEQLPQELDSKSAIPAQKIASLNDKINRGNLTKDFPELIALSDSSQKLASQLRSNSFFYGVSDGFGIDSPVFIRGNHLEPSEELIPRSFLSALPLGKENFKSSGSGRLELAQAMLDKDNPLTSRVMVNRIWHHLFGRGIVETVDNFGLQGKLPSHPELLDYLAIKFQNEDWSIKKMVRAIVSTEAFKRSTIRDDQLHEADPLNTYLASFPVRRLEAEAIRDGILMAAENLNDSLYGPPVGTYLTDFMQGRGRPSASGPLDGNGRRSIYLEVRRNFLEPMMTTFDRPIPFSTFGKRDVTNVPSQSLIILNDPFVAQQAELMAKKLLSQSNLSFEERISWVYKRAFAREPSKEELAKAKEFMDLLGEMKPASEIETQSELEIWKQYCHSMFNLKEFIYLI